MTRKKTYRTKVRLRKNTAEVDGAYCNCKAGANGYCKHVGAVLYSILDFVESGFEEIPPNKSCTEKPQEWHKPRGQNPDRNTTVYFNEILMIRHDYDADKNNKTYKQRKRKIEKQSYSACPSYALKLTSEQIHSFCRDLRGNPDESKPMICDLLEGNDYKPVVVKDLENEIAKYYVLMDHDYQTGKQNPGPEVKAMSPEVSHSSSCKRQKLCSILGNEYEPFENNLRDSLPISHSVLIAPEHNENIDQESVFAADDEQQPTGKSTTEQSETFNNVDAGYVQIPYKEQVVSDKFDLTNPTLTGKCREYLSKIKMTSSEVEDVEKMTRGQSSNPEWFKYRSGRITASKFGEVNNRRSTTAPDRLVRDLFQYKTKTTTPFQCAEGLRLEPAIRQKYVEYQHNHGHDGLCVNEKGLVIDPENAFLAASVDGEVTDPSNTNYPVGNLELKYKLYPDKIVHENNGTRLLVNLATKTKNCCLEVTDSGLRLKRKHHFYAQVQGGMAIRKLQWSDFVVYTCTSNAEDIHVKRIHFDPICWASLKVKLVDFYLFAMVPELLTTRVKRGVPLYPGMFPYN